MASKVLSVLLGVLVLTGCAGMSSQTVKPEKLVLDWTDFYPAPLLPGCNQSYSVSDPVKSMQRLCYQPMPYAVTDRYALMIDTFIFDLDNQGYFEKHLAKKRSIAEELTSNFHNDCLNEDIHTVGDNAIYCRVSDNKKLFATAKYQLMKGKLVEIKLLMNFDDITPITKNSSEYRKAMRIINDKNLAVFFE